MNHVRRRHKLSRCTYCGKAFLHRADKEQPHCSKACANLDRTFAAFERTEQEPERTVGQRLAEGFEMLGGE